jgi:GH43 family beta-xylosidase
MVFHQGWYYYCESCNDQRSIRIRRSRTIAQIAQDPGTFVWHAPPKGGNSHAVWAPELHWLNGKWFIDYAADNGENENHRMWVLEAETEDPQGSYRCRGMIETCTRNALPGPPTGCPTSGPLSRASGLDQPEDMRHWQEPSWPFPAGG